MCIHLCEYILLPILMCVCVCVVFVVRFVWVRVCVRVCTNTYIILPEGMRVSLHIIIQACIRGTQNCVQLQKPEA